MLETRCIDCTLFPNHTFEVISTGYTAKKLWSIYTEFLISQKIIEAIDHVKLKT